MYSFVGRRNKKKTKLGRRTKKNGKRNETTQKKQHYFTTVYQGYHKKEQPQPKQNAALTDPAACGFGLARQHCGTTRRARGPRATGCLRSSTRLGTKT